MDSQLNNYVIFKGKEQWSFPMTLDKAVATIRNLESGMNRLREHSPWTIQKATKPMRRRFSYAKVTEQRVNA